MSGHCTQLLAATTQTPLLPLVLGLNLFNSRWTTKPIRRALRHRFLTATLDLRAAFGVTGYVFHARWWILTWTRFAI